MALIRIQRLYDKPVITSNECMCSNIRPLFKDMALETQCRLLCDGDTTKICGGILRISVYSNHVESTNAVASNYIGCYTDSEEERTFSHVAEASSNSWTPERCVGHCYRRGNRFAALQNGNECYCGNTVPTRRKVSDKECNVGCRGDKRFACGGRTRNSVYHTDIPDEPEDDKVLGCYKDDAQSRQISGHWTTFRNSNTPRLCYNVCKKLNFRYSGVEFGHECFCGNTAPTSSRVLEVECTTPCPGDRLKNCGGGNRILVYDNKIRSSPQYPATSENPTKRPASPATRRPISTTGKRQAPSKTQLRPMIMMPNCAESMTMVKGKRVCQRQVLFEDRFDRNALNADVWSNDIIMPWIPDYEFIVFQNKRENLYIKNNKLFIRPTVQNDDFVRRGKLELKGCTGSLYTDECVRQAATFSILPPIESARITTKDSVTFKYGTIQIRAKLPIGDWIVPEIWLEPKRRTYGPSYASGRIRIAMARGNRHLSSKERDIGNNILESGIIMGVGENTRARTIILENAIGWHSFFHNYTFTWTPDNLQFSVDGQNTQSLLPQKGQSLAEVVGFDESTRATWGSGTKLAPFDEEFYISLGVSVGGMRDFPDGCKSSGHVKPWSDHSVKAMVNFWQDRNSWLNTWEGDDSALQIEHVIVTAL